MKFGRPNALRSATCNSDSCLRPSFSNSAPAHGANLVHNRNRKANVESWGVPRCLGTWSQCCWARSGLAISPVGGQRQKFLLLDYYSFLIPAVLLACCPFHEQHNMGHAISALKLALPCTVYRLHAACDGGLIEECASQSCLREVATEATCLISPRNVLYKVFFNCL